MDRSQQQVHYCLPFSNASEIGLTRNALKEYLHRNSDQAEQIMPALKKVKLLFSIAVAEDHLAKLNQEFRDLTGGCEPYDI